MKFRVNAEEMPEVIQAEDINEAMALAMTYVSILDEEEIE
tara:strand:- start:1666 stop:1785 length:120 start_codon:yes stop_codon:yes gene_type:complete